jgi:hypothetical protein
MLHTLLDNFLHNLFKPMLLFFYAGFLIPVLGISFDFPQVLYQGLTIYLLVAIGWHGGEELAELPASLIPQASGFMLIGFLTNLAIGLVAYLALRKFTKLRNVDAATVAGYYGSDSAGTFVTCLGVLAASKIAFAAYMPVMLAVMEIPGCLVALVLVAYLRRKGLDPAGNMAGEAGYTKMLAPVVAKAKALTNRAAAAADHDTEIADESELDSELVGVAGGDYERVVHGRGSATTTYGRNGRSLPHTNGTHRTNGTYRLDDALPDYHSGADDIDLEGTDHGPTDVSLQEGESTPAKSASIGKLLHEVFLNPGSFLLFAGLVIGFVGRLQGQEIVSKGDSVFVNLFQGLLCLFLLEMGMTASKRLKDIRQAGWQFVAFALLAPNVFAIFGICVAHAYSMFLGQPFELGTYALFAVLCGAASYIAVPALQRMAIPEASPTLPLAASLGLTFSYNVTVGIPVYLMVATAITQAWPVAG